MFKKRTQIKMAKENTGALDIGMKAARAIHPIFTDYDKTQISRNEQKIQELEEKLRLLASVSGYVFMKHDKYKRFAIISKDVLKKNETLDDSSTDCEQER